MSISTQIAHSIEMVKGGVKRMADRITGSRRPQADQAKGDIKQA